MICLKHKQKYGKGEWCIYCGNPNDKGEAKITARLPYRLQDTAGGLILWSGVPGLSLGSSYEKDFYSQYKPHKPEYNPDQDINTYMCKKK
jgi:hypothetical protein